MSYDNWPDSNYANTALQTWSASPYFNLAGQVARQNGIDPSVFQAIIGAESGYDPNASNGNAIGLGQLVVGSAPALSGIDAGNPQVNLNASANFYSQLLGECNGDYVCASAKYGTLPKSVLTGNTSGLTQNQQLVYNAELNANQNNAVTECYGTGSSYTEQVMCALGIGNAYTSSNTEALANSTASNDAKKYGVETCSSFDLACYIKNYGADFLTIIAGLAVLIVGIVMLRDRSTVSAATNSIGNHLVKRGKQLAEVIS